MVFWRPIRCLFQRPVGTFQKWRWIFVLTSNNLAQIWCRLFDVKSEVFWVLQNFILGQSKKINKDHTVPLSFIWIDTCTCTKKQNKVLQRNGILKLVILYEFSNKMRWINYEYKHMKWTQSMNAIRSTTSPSHCNRFKVKKASLHSAVLSVQLNPDI